MAAGPSTASGSQAMPLGTLLGKFSMFQKSESTSKGKSRRAFNGIISSLAEWMERNDKGQLTKANVNALTADDIASFQQQGSDNRTRASAANAIRTFLRFADSIQLQ